MAYSKNTKINEASLKSTLIDTIYPVGSIYMSTANTSPASFLGGTWEQLKDRFLLGAGNSYSVNTTGGETTHTLTKAEMPSHNHSASSNSTGGHTHGRGSMNITGTVHGVEIQVWYGQSISASGCFAGSTITSGGEGNGNYGVSTINFNAANNWGGETSSNGGHAHTITVNNEGSGNAHNNMPPYLAVYMWKRTA